MRTALTLVAILAVANIIIAYNDARQVRDRHAELTGQVETTRVRNERLKARAEGLLRDPALMERWLRQREHLAPNEEVVR